MSVNYTQAGFTVTSLYEDSGQKTTKKIVTPNINWEDDFTVVSAESKEAHLLNKTGSNLTQFEKVRIGRQEIANIYANSDSVNAAKLQDTRGVQVMVEVKEVYQAIASATGAVYDLPVTARLVVRTPYNPIVNPQLIQDAALRAVAMLGAYNDSDDPDASPVRTVVDAITGDLTPVKA